MSENGTAFDWGDTIENEGAGFVLLPAGEYNFTVKDLNRSRHGGSIKLPPCNKAVLTIEFDGGDLGKTTFTENLHLHSKCEWILCAFFTALGMRKSGEQLTMDWDAVKGATGRASIKVRKYNHNTKKNPDGSPLVMESNQVDKWLAPVVAEEPTGFTAGKF